MWVFTHPMKPGCQEKRKQSFVELRGMPVDAVAEVHAPRQIGGDAVGLIRQTSGEATDPADGDSE